MTWQTVDFFLELVSKGSTAELAEYVARPDEFDERRESTSFVVMDQTALWLKLRGEERVIACAEELDDAKCLRSNKQKLRGARGEENKQLVQELVEVSIKNKCYRDEQVAQHTTAGDKYRLTLVNISGVEGGFNPRLQPRPRQKRGILIVPCSSHCKLEDIGKDDARETGATSAATAPRSITSRATRSATCCKAGGMPEATTRAHRAGPPSF